MNLATELAQCDPYSTSPEVLAILFKRWATQAQCDAEQIKQDAEQIKKDAEQIARQRTEIHCKETKIAALTLELAHHKRLRFAAKTESLSIGQRDLFNECCETDLAAIQAELVQLTPAVTRTKRKPTGRKALPAELPRIEHRHEPESCSCGACGADLVKIGEDITEQPDVEPARFFVQRHIRPQYACRHCETVTAAPIPAAVIDGGLATPGLHAWVVIQKYLDHRVLRMRRLESQRNALPKMRGGPSKSACRSRLQTATSCGY